MTEKRVPHDAFTNGNSDMEGGNSNQQSIDDAVNEALERKRKKRDIIVFNLPEIPMMYLLTCRPLMIWQKKWS